MRAFDTLCVCDRGRANHRHCSPGELRTSVYPLGELTSRLIEWLWLKRAFCSQWHSLSCELISRQITSKRAHQLQSSLTSNVLESHIVLCRPHSLGDSVGSTEVADSLSLTLVSATSINGRFVRVWTTKLLKSQFEQWPSGQSLQLLLIMINLEAVGPPAVTFSSGWRVQSLDSNFGLQCSCRWMVINNHYNHYPVSKRFPVIFLLVQSFPANSLEIVLCRWYVCSNVFNSEAILLHFPATFQFRIRLSEPLCVCYLRTLLPFASTFSALTVWLQCQWLVASWKKFSFPIISLLVYSALFGRNKILSLNLISLATVPIVC